MKNAPRPNSGVARAANTNPRASAIGTASSAARRAGIRAGGAVLRQRGHVVRRRAAAREQQRQDAQRRERDQVAGADEAVGRERDLDVAAAGRHAPRRAVGVADLRRAEVVAVAGRPAAAVEALGQHEPGGRAHVEPDAGRGRRGWRAPGESTRPGAGAAGAGAPERSRSRYGANVPAGSDSRAGPAASATAPQPATRSGWPASSCSIVPVTRSRSAAAGHAPGEARTRRAARRPAGRGRAGRRAR